MSGMFFLLVNELGHIVENRVTQLALWKTIEAQPEVTLLCPQKPIRTYRQGDTMHVVTESGQAYQGKLLIAADGGQSMVRQQFGIGVNRAQYQQACLVASVNTQASKTLHGSGLRQRDPRHFYHYQGSMGRWFGIIRLMKLGV